MIRNITDKKRGEQLALENERMKSQVQNEQKRNALIQRIVSTLSHDLRTPLAVVESSRYILSKHYDSLDDTRRQEKLETIGRQIQFALKLLQDTVDLARGNLTENRFNPRTINLEALCQVSIQEVGSVYGRKKTIQFVNKSAVSHAYVDETLMTRILLNLLSNAIKYTKEEDMIWLELDRQDDQIILRIADTGMGISETDLPNIFSPFYRADQAKSVKGTGLGLSIVSDCVSQHNGTIHVESELGKGTTFIVTLPDKLSTVTDATALD